MMPRLSVIIPCYNAKEWIGECLDSVVSQGVEHVEIVIQDGGSTDGTLDVIDRYGDLVKCVSEPDSGQSDALNRALSRATGDIVGWLNADDLYSPGVIAAVLNEFDRDPSLDMVFGDFAMIGKDGEMIRRYYLNDLSWDKVFHKGCYIFSGASFFRRTVYERFGDYDASLHYTMDFEFLLRIARSVRALHVPVIAAYFRIHDASKSGGVPLRFVREGWRVRQRYGDGALSLRLVAALAVVERTAYLATRWLWLSQMWSSVRRSKRL